MKRNVLFLILPLTIGILSSCGSHTHFENFSYDCDDTSHWKVCSCGQEDTHAAHSFEKVRNVQDGQHTDSGIELHKCPICSYSKQVESGRVRFAVSPEDTGTITIANDDVYTWLDSYEPGSSQPYQGKGDIYYPKDVTLSWDITGHNYSYYVVKIWNEKDYENVSLSTVETNSLTISNLFVDIVYYWQVECYDSNDNLKDTSTEYSFYVEKTPRTIRIDGVSNSRDIGGKETTNDRVIKQGMVYRSANLDSITPTGKNQCLETFKIKTDLDLRSPTEVTSSYSPISRDINYINVAGCYWYDGANGLNVESNWASRMVYEIKPFAKASNYPIIFHCAIGQDRTGSLAIVLEGLLGVTPEEINIDYELSSFCSVVWDDANPIYVTNKLKYQYNPLINYLNSFGTEEEPFMDKVERYVKAIGITDDEIAAIRNIMWEEE